MKITVMESKQVKDFKLPKNNYLAFPYLSFLFKNIKEAKFRQKRIRNFMKKNGFKGIVHMSEKGNQKEHLDKIPNNLWEMDLESWTKAKDKTEAIKKFEILKKQLTTKFKCKVYFKD